MTDLRQYFSQITLPDSILLQSGVLIFDLPRFVESHLAMIEAGDEEWREVYRYRLEILKDKLNERTNL